MLKLEKSKNKKRLCCRLKVFTICTNLQKMETLCQHSPLNKDTNIQIMDSDDLLLLSPIPALLRHAPLRTQPQRRPNNQRTHELAVEMASAVEAAQTLLLLCGD